MQKAKYRNAEISNDQTFFSRFWFFANAEFRDFIHLVIEKD